jgi:hypothetical protein
MRNVWDILGVVHEPEVSSGRDDHCQRLGTSRARDLSWGSTSPKGPRLMFGKGGPRPKAQAKTPVLLTGMTSVTRVPVFAAVKTERREGSG